MLKISFIGNIGSDARVQQFQEGEFIVFNVACNEGRDRVVWVSCSSRNHIKLREWLVRGQAVYCEGILITRLYTGRDGSQQIGINCLVNQIELVGSSPRNQQSQIQQPKQGEHVPSKDNEKNSSSDDCPF